MEIVSTQDGLAESCAPSSLGLFRTAISQLNSKVEGFKMLRNIWSVDVVKVWEKKEEKGPMILSKFLVTVFIYHGSHYVKPGQYGVEIETYYAVHGCANTRVSRIYYRDVGMGKEEQTIYEGANFETVVRLVK